MLDIIFASTVSGRYIHIINSSVCLSIRGHPVQGPTLPLVTSGEQDWRPAPKNLDIRAKPKK